MDFHARICPSIRDRMVPLNAKENLRSLSSSLVRLSVSYHLDVSEYVPAFVQQRLYEKLHGQYKIGLTGAIATGKTFVAARLVELLKARGIKAHHINVDGLVRDLYTDTSCGAQKVRNALAKRFGENVLSADKAAVQLETLKHVTFGKPEEMCWVSNLTRPHIERKLRKALTGKQGVIILEWAQLAEMSLGHLANHHSIVVSSLDQHKFARMRGLDPKQLAQISRQQLSAQKKAELLRFAAQEAKNGSVVMHRNVFREDMTQVDKDLEELITHILSTFHLQ